MSEESKATAYLSFELQDEEVVAFNTWRDRVLAAVVPKDLQKHIVKRPSPHLTVFFDCVANEDRALSLFRKHCPPSDTFSFLPTTGKVGDQASVLVVYGEMPAWIRVVETLFQDTAFNPKGIHTKHARFDYAKSQTNPFGFVPHMTLAVFDGSVELSELHARMPQESVKSALQNIAPVNVPHLCSSRVTYKELKKGFVDDC